MQDMIDHGLDGTGTNYSNPELTRAVSDHAVTKRFMKDTENVFKNKLINNKGDIRKVETIGLAGSMRDKDVILSQYSYGGGVFDRDTYTGLTFAVHSWTSVKISVKNYRKKGNKYSGVLYYEFRDTFGLDKVDIEDSKIHGSLVGFRSWYILQHYRGYKGKYRLFDTVVELDQPFTYEDR